MSNEIISDVKKIKMIGVDIENGEFKNSIYRKMNSKLLNL